MQECTKTLCSPSYSSKTFFSSEGLSSLLPKPAFARINHSHDHELENATWTVPLSPYPAQNSLFKFPSSSLMKVLLSSSFRPPTRSAPSWTELSGTGAPAKPRVICNFDTFIISLGSFTSGGALWKLLGKNKRAPEKMKIVQLGLGCGMNLSDDLLTRNKSVKIVV